MIDQKRITEEAEHFFEWPDPKRKEDVTLTSCVIFAATIAEMARKEERERMQAGREDLVAAWNDLPDELRCHPSLKRLYAAAQKA
jgi:hypothetical protein